MKDNAFYAILLIAVMFFLSQPSGQNINIDSTGSDNAVLTDLIQPDVSFTGKNLFLQGTSLTGESVRILKGQTDLGHKSLNSGTLSLDPGVDYRFIFFMNDSSPSSTYYTDIMDYTAPIKESTENLVGQGCTIDTAPYVIVRNSNGYVQSSTANVEAIGASTTRNIEIEIRPHTDKCFGTPDAPYGNVICFGYSSTYFTSVKANTDYMSTPYSISQYATSLSSSCYTFNTLADAESQVLTVQLTSGSNPTTDHNISIFIDDINFDLDQTTLTDIWGYTDESGNQLGYAVSATPIDYIYVS